MKLKNTLYIVFSLFISITIISCSKKDEGGASGEAFLTCKFNGEPKTFNYFVNANGKPTKVVNFVVIGGFEKDISGNSFGIEMLIPGEGAKVGTYTVAGGSAPELDGQYCVQLFNNGNHVGTDCYIGGRSSGTNFTLNITSLDNWGVKGTFSGRLKQSGGDTYITVTDGKFSAPYEPK